MPLGFVVTDVFHLRQRGVVLASGRMLKGSIAGRVTAYDEATGRPVEILGDPRGSSKVLRPGTLRSATGAQGCAAP